MDEGARPSPANYERIADALVARQGQDREKADQLAERIASGGEDIVAAAVEWAATGTMPEYPQIAGYSPAQLAVRLSPSQVFTGLVALRENPAVARDLFRYPPIDSPRARTRDWEGRVRDALGAVPEIELVSDRPVGPDRRSRPDFLVHVNGKQIVVEANATPPRLDRLRRAIEQVERYVLVFKAHGGLVVVPEEPEGAVSPRGYLASVSVTDLDHLARSLLELARRVQ